MSLPVTRGRLAALGVYYIGAVVLTHYHKLAGAGAVVLGLLLFAPTLRRLLGATLLDSWKLLDAEAEVARREAGDGGFDPRPLVVLCTAALSLTLIEYYGDRGTFSLLVSRWAPGFNGHHYYNLAGFAYWSGFRVVGYILLPWLANLLLPGERLRDQGLAFKGVLRHLWIYGVLFLIVLLPVVMVSLTPSFQRIYPFYKQAARSWTDFLAWEAMYAVQFFALEVFFRGFMLHPLKRSMGSYAIFCMAVPYCMIHYNKHLAEVLGAVAAGIVLGTLSLRTGSIWAGVLIHISVAISMDSLALVQTAGFPGNPRFIGR